MAAEIITPYGRDCEGCSRLRQFKQTVTEKGLDGNFAVACMSIYVEPPVSIYSSLSPLGGEGLVESISGTPPAEGCPLSDFCKKTG